MVIFLEVAIIVYDIAFKEDLPFLVWALTSGFLYLYVILFNDKQSLQVDWK